MIAVFLKPFSVFAAYSLAFREVLKSKSSTSLIVVPRLFALLLASSVTPLAFGQLDPRWDYAVPDTELDYAGERFIIIGDSLSTELESWTNQLRILIPDLNLHNWAQGRRSISGYELPVDIISDQEPTVFILGSNDYWASDAQTTRAATRELLQKMVDFNMKVTVILPPYHPKWFKDSPQYKQDAIRNAIVEVAESLNLPIEDLNDIWDSEKTIDGIHPNETLSMEIAIWVYAQATRPRD